MRKRLVLVLVVLLACTAPLSSQTTMQVIVNSPRPISYINSWANNAGAGGASSFAVTVATVTGDTVCVGVGIRTTADTVSSISDGGGSTYTEVNSFVNTTNNEAEEMWCTGPGAAKASTSLTVNLSGSTEVVATVGDYRGVAAIGASTATDNTALVNTLTVSLATTDHNDRVVATMVQASSDTFTASVGNLRIQQSDTANLTAVLNDNTSATPATVTNTVTSNGSHSYCAVAVVLRP